MKILLFLSDAIIPLLIFSVVGYGILQKQRVYDQFIEGAKDGFHTVLEIMPTLIGLMVAVDFFSSILSVVTDRIGFPAELLPVSVVKMFSSSAATGLLLDIYKQHGTDSFLGLAASLMLSSTETIFYTMSIYFMSAKVTKTRYTLVGALLATFGGMAASILLAGRM